MNDEQNFGELIGILHTEELLRLQRRSQLNNLPRLAQILGDQIAVRDKARSQWIEKAPAK